MEFKINVQDFASALQPVVDISNRGENKDYDYAGKITLRVEEKGIALIAHNGLASIISFIGKSEKYPNLNYSMVEGGEVTVDSDLFMGELQSLSYSPEVNLKLENNQMIASAPYYDENKKHDGDNSETCPTYSTIINSPPLAKKFETEIIINRQVFINGMNKVNFAIGFEANQSYYMCQVLDVAPGSLRFVSGTGGRFAINDIKGKTVVSVDEKAQVIFPHHSISNIINVLNDAGDLDIKVKKALRTKDNPDQIVLELENTTLIILGLDPSIKYPDVNKIMTLNYPNEVSTNLEDWTHTTAGIDITYTSDMKKKNDIHNSDVKAELNKKRFLIRTHTKAQATRYVAFKPKKQIEADSVSFRCNSVYLSELIKRGYKTGKMTIKFKDEDTPILVEFPENINGVKKFTEDFTIFFSTSRR